MSTSDISTANGTLAVTIRRAKETDIPAMETLLGEVDELHLKGAPWMFQKSEEPRWNSWLDEFLSKPDKLALVAEDGEVMGLVFAYLRTRPLAIIRPASFAELDALVVRESSRRRGIGRLLVQRTVAWASEQGAERVELGVYQFNEPARAFWQSVGFEVYSMRMMLRPGSDG